MQYTWVVEQWMPAPQLARTPVTVAKPVPALQDYTVSQ